MDHLGCEATLKLTFSAVTARRFVAENFEPDDFLLFVYFTTKKGVFKILIIITKRKTNKFETPRT